MFVKNGTLKKTLKGEDFRQFCLKLNKIWINASSEKNARIAEREKLEADRVFYENECRGKLMQRIAEAGKPIIAAIDKRLEEKQLARESWGNELNLKRLAVNLERDVRRCPETPDWLYDEHKEKHLRDNQIRVDRGEKAMTWEERIENCRQQINLKREAIVWFAEDYLPQYRWKMYAYNQDLHVERKLETLGLDDVDFEKTGAHAYDHVRLKDRLEGFLRFGEYRGDWPKDRKLTWEYIFDVLNEKDEFPPNQVNRADAMEEARE